MVRMQNEHVQGTTTFAAAALRDDYFWSPQKTETEG